MSTDNQPDAPVDVTGLEPAPREFAAVLLDLRKGKTNDELSTAVREVVAAVRDTGKAGSITLVVKFAPGSDPDEQVTTSDEVKVAIPQPARKSTSFFITDDGDLVRDDPKAVPFPGMPSPR